jgi:ubiquinone/menaquinone biosynthesis C-methylase UbiE
MNQNTDGNRFEQFFSEEKYTLLKNYLYNYLLRKDAIENALKHEAVDRILEVGSGISPVMTRTDRIVYTDLSLAAVRTLKSSWGNRWYVVADCTNLPFKQNSFSHAICSEVLEHIPDDKTAMRELNRILKPPGRLIVTFPHRKFYFAIDDRLVKHYRRYELAEMKQKLKSTGFSVASTQKILGPLEKLTMIIVAAGYVFFRKIGAVRQRSAAPDVTARKKTAGLFLTLFKWANRAYAKIVMLDAKLVPRIFSTVLMINCVSFEKINNI